MYIEHTNEPARTFYFENCLKFSITSGIIFSEEWNWWDFHQKPKRKSTKKNCTTKAAYEMSGT